MHLPYKVENHHFSPYLRKFKRTKLDERKMFMMHCFGEGSKFKCHTFSLNSRMKTFKKKKHSVDFEITYCSRTGLISTKKKTLVF